MKNLVLLVLAVVSLASCSTPKYTYHFENRDYGAATKKKQAPVQEVARVTPEEIMEAVQGAQQIEEPVAVASTAKEIFPSKKAAKATVKAESTAAPVTMTKEEKRELKAQIKSAIKDYKKQAREGSQAEGGDKNQLVTLLLAIFLGGLGIHRFYLGKTGTAIAQLALFVVGVILPPLLIALAVWVLIDIIFIAIGKLTPKSGKYNPGF